MFKRMLVPLDGSQLAEKALEQVKGLAEECCEVHLLQVIRLPLPVMTPDIGMSVPVIDMEELLGEATNYLETRAGELRASGIETTVHVVEDDNIADAIVDYALEIDADLIVQSTHGRGGLSRLVFGSVAEAVLRQAPCPVMLVRAQEKD